MLRRLAGLAVLLAAAGAASATTEPPVEAVALVETIAAEVTCARGTYYWGVWETKHYCVKCPATYTSNGCTNCKPDPTRTSCYKPVACAKGTFVKSGACAKCPVGYWQSQPSQTLCYGCPGGMYQPTEGLYSCYYCPVGRFADQKGQSACKKCDQCAKGKFGKTDKVGKLSASDCTCDDCPAGRYTPAGYQTCFDCPTGRFYPKAGGYSCYYCPTGKFGPDTASSACATCPTGKATTARGQTTEGKCLKTGCDLGKFKYKHNDGNFYCVDCPAGKFGGLINDATVCAACPGGYFTADAGQTKCQTKSDVPEYTVHFKSYNYKLSSTLAQSGWKLLTYADIAKYQELFVADYVQDGGLEMMGAWATSGCCMTLANGYRLTANGVSFVYPMDSTGASMQCSTSSTTYQTGYKYKLAYHENAQFQDLSTAKKLYAAGGTQMCATKAGEGNPGVYMGKAPGASAYAKTCRVIDGERLCLTAPTTTAPTTAPTHVPSTAPTDAPGIVTSSPTVAPTTAAPTKQPTVPPTKQPTATPTQSPTHQAQDCEVASWNIWGICSAECGGGVSKRTRQITKASMYDGKECPGTSEVRNCNTQSCVVHCDFDWKPWTQCSKTCGGGVQHKDAVVHKQAANGGDACPSREERVCNVSPCPIDCRMSEWSAWTRCTSSCGAGVRTRYRHTTYPNMYGGKHCGSMIEMGQCEDASCPVDCKVSHWDAWTACDKSCNKGRKSRHRSVEVQTAFGGRDCGALKQTMDCNIQNCPINCEVGPYSKWTACSVSCGKGTHTRERKVVQQQSDGGSYCPLLHEESTCDEGQCPVHCTVGDWGGWSACSKSCGGGFRTKERAILMHPLHGGYACPILKSSESCSDDPCPIDCVVAGWEEWNQCSVTCGTGEQTRTRSIITNADHFGKRCPVLSEVKNCNTQNCAVDCEVSPWGKYSACSSSCGKGHQVRSRSITRASLYGGSKCPAASQFRECSDMPCPVDCIVSNWLTWDPCSKSCGSGKQTRQRSVSRAAEFGGLACPSLSQRQGCNYNPCPIDCQVGHWSEFSDCSVSCTAGTMKRTRSTLTSPALGGKKCPPLEDVQTCDLGDCPVHCEVSVWASWSTCTKSCTDPQGAHGRRDRTRTVTKQAALGGVVCPHLEEEQVCNSEACPVDCVVSAFADWSECSRSCGTGERQKHRYIQVNSAFGGKKCPALFESETCNSQNCPIDCEVSQWSEFNPCSTTCGSGIHERHRSMKVAAAFGGQQCPPVTEEQSCNTEQCPVDCVVSEFGEFGECSTTCGTGEHAQTRTVLAEAAFGGIKCPSLINSMGCSEGPCPVHCEVSAWTAWNACTITCGSGFHTRTRHVTAHAAHGGYVCPSLTEESTCNEHTCAVDCVLSQWGQYSACSKTCSSGVRTRFRTILRSHIFGGKECGQLKEHKECNTQECPVNCDITAWTVWSDCSRECDTGSQDRSRTVVAHPAFGGMECPVLQQQQTCTEGPCPIHCKVSPWTSYTACTTTCGGGSQSRERSITEHAAHGGYTCPYLSETRACSNAKCPIDCVVSSWTPLSECSVSCKTGQKTRERVVKAAAQAGGKACPALSETYACDEGPCPVHCVVTDFTAWSSCGKTCGGGSRSRIRKVITHAAHGGYVCPNLHETEACADEPCAVDCTVGLWSEWSQCTKSCGGNRVSRTRAVSTFPKYGGVQCPSLYEVKDACTQLCPVDCVVTEWSAWAPCSKSCGTGTKLHKRTIQVVHQAGGKVCPKLEEVWPCNKNNCPVDCEVSAFGEWGACSKSCNGGQSLRHRSITRQLEFGGKKCHPISETQNCNTQPCPIDCEMTEWGDWDSCSSTCDAGKHSRRRWIAIAAQHGGVECAHPKDVETKSCTDGPCPVHCEVTQWTTWSACNLSCGSGTSSRSRSITKHSENGGFTCPLLAEDRSCNTDACPIDCVVSEWEQWGACSTTCGTGTKTRVRTASTNVKHGGKACPNLSEVENCNTQPCPIDCKVSEWGAFLACSKTCGNSGISERYRSKTVEPAFGGAACPHFKEMHPCQRFDCPVDCQLSDWREYSACTATCGSGTKTRSRLIEVEPAHGGLSCELLEHTELCNVDPCPVDCIIGTWETFGACPKSCGTGRKQRHRSIIRNSEFGGKICPALIDFEDCNTHFCPQDCTTSEWTEWSTCSKTCGVGSHRRTRNTVLESARGGAACPGMSETKQCNNGECPPPPVSVAMYMTISGETATSFTDAKRLAYRKSIAAALGINVDDVEVQVSAKDGHNRRLIEASELTLVVTIGTTSITAADTLTAQVQESTFSNSLANELAKEGVEVPTGSIGVGDVDTTVANGHCKVSQWTAWTECSQSCGGGNHVRTRTVIAEKTPNEKVTVLDCPSLKQTEQCNAQACPADCVHSEWGSWTTCTKTCGHGVQHRDRSVEQAPTYGGKTCESLHESQECAQTACPTDCVVADWGSWTQCSATCGSGTKSKFRFVTTAANNGGTPCPSLEETVMCNTNACPIDCAVGRWEGYGLCSVSCGHGSRTRTRTVMTEPLFGGNACPAIDQSEVCNTHACPEDCKMTEWSEWTQCTASCNSGAQSRSRSLIARERFGGSSCPELVETAVCNFGPCPIDCIVGAWEPWSACTVTCGGGSRTSTRAPVQDAVHGGKHCPSLKKVEPCNNEHCPIDCETSEWYAWGTCTVSCGAGTQTRTKVVIRQPTFGGVECPMLTQTQPCSDGACPVHCVTTPFSAWTECSKTCGTGDQTRSRSVVSHPANGGYTCPDLGETRLCNSDPCPVDCVVSSFSAWSECTKSCGVGAETRTRQITTAQAFGGKQCAALTETRACNPQNCPIDCEITLYSGWSACTASCGAGTKSRSRSVAVAAQEGGKACPSLTESKACSTQSCPSDCQVSQWGEFGECSTSCGGGQYARHRTVLKVSKFGGAACPQVLKQVADCNAQICPIDCVLTVWGEWSICSMTCGTGTSQRHRSVAQGAAFGGKSCGPELESMECNKQSCALDCTMDSWSEWLECSTSCGGGMQVRSRSIAIQAAYGGKACPIHQQQQSCNSHICARDCAVTQWSDWSECSHSCGEGTEKRSRTVTIAPLVGGQPCPSLTMIKQCNAGKCPVHCEVSEWAAWSDCTKSCGGGERVRSRKITTHSGWGGYTCPSLIDRSDCNDGPCPVDCILSAFHPYDACSKSCGTGFQTKTRTVVTAAQFGGATCASLSETQDCKLSDCPVDCVVSPFSAWGTCDASCDAGKQTRTRSINRPVAYGGKVCPHLQEEQACNNHVCPVDCQVSDFGDYSACSKSCGMGEQTRKRNIVVTPAMGGFHCPHLTDSRACHEQPCPVDCQASEWSEWAPCSYSCGGGQTSRTRDTTINLAYGGKPCSAMLETKSCNEQGCPVACIVSDFDGWTACDKSCGNGSQSRTRKISRNAAHGGSECPALVQEQPCNTQQCPLDCVTTQWSDWGACSETCGSGSEHRHRSIIGAEQAGGVGCGKLTGSRPCNTKPCPVHCTVSAWSEWGECSKSCGTGQMQRSRSRENAPAHGGSLCPALKSVNKCNEQSCPVDCHVAEWGAWSECSRSCGADGTRYHARQVIADHGFGGKVCPTLFESEACGTEACPVDCVMSTFDKWSLCTKTCGSGSQSRSRTILTAPMAGGKLCPEKSEQRSCNDQKCPVDCDISLWSDWSECSTSCGVGTQDRSRTITKEPSNGGTSCPVLKQQQQCDEGACPLHCDVSAYGAWSLCSRSCGGGSQTRTRTVTTHAEHGGYQCPALEEDRTCHTDPCPVDCQVSEWTAYGSCSHSCGKGKTARTRDVIAPAQHGGAACGALIQAVECEEGPCPVHCQVDAWGVWSPCTKSCGFGYRHRSRSITVHRAHNGYVCPALSAQESCNTQACPIDCKVGKWGDFAQCSKSCGVGSKTRTRPIEQHPMYSGAACPSLTTSTSCNDHHCPIDCEVSEWSQASVCDKSCGGGSQQRTRTMTVAAMYGGASCPELTSTLTCNEQSCPVNCVQSVWSEWGNCDLTCGSGYATRMRTTFTPSLHGGIACGALVESKACNTQDCPVDCKMSEWGAFDTCTTTCGSGSHTRTRSIARATVFGGKQCPSMTEIRPCETHACPIDCEVSDWGVWSKCSHSCDGPSGKGRHTRQRRTEKAPQFGGVLCPALIQSMPCNNGPCPVHCEVSEWSDWAPCAKSCGGGLKDRHRTVISHAQHGGYACPFLGEYAPCNEHACPADCEVTGWSPWTQCEKSCGSGHRYRGRVVTKATSAGGAECPILGQHEVCNAFPCPIDCEVTAWSVETACSLTCGGGQKTKHRSVLVPSAFDGVECPALVHTTVCNDQPCAVDCAVSEWTPFGECTKECGGGIQTRTRRVLTPVAFGGVQCPTVAETATCNQALCVIDCQVSQFSEWSACSVSCQGGTRHRKREVVTLSENGGASCPELEETGACAEVPCPEDCHVGEWKTWSTCTDKCGGGTRVRHREITNVAEEGGHPCPPVTEEEPCNLHHCFCSHVQCVVNPKTKHIIVHHHATLKYDKNDVASVPRHGAEQMGSHHTCAFNYASDACECRCGELKEKRDYV